MMSYYRTLQQSSAAFKMSTLRFHVLSRLFCWLPNAERLGRQLFETSTLGWPSLSLLAWLPLCQNSMLQRLSSSPASTIQSQVLLSISNLENCISIIGNRSTEQV